MSNSDGGARPWDLDQYRPGVKRVVRAPRSDVPGQEWDDSVDDGRQIRATYDPDGTPLLLLAMWTALLTVATFGLYRFWMVTRLRRYFWGAVRIEGDPMEYTGRGIEKFLGFLIAIIFLVIYLGLVNLALTFAGLTLGSEIAINASLLSALPLYYFAVYRARRYIMARTRWRGIRFGMENGAWSFSLRAILYGLITVLSAGLLYPLMHYRLEKYMVDRTWFGDLKFEQKGTWLGLFGSWFWIYVVGAFIGLATWTMAEVPEDVTSIVIAVVILTFGYTALWVAFMVYQVAAFRYLWDTRTLGGSSFSNDISSGSVVWIYIGGTFLVSICSTVMAVVLMILFQVLATVLMTPDDAALLEGVLDGTISPMALTTILPVVIVSVLLILLFFASFFAFSQVFIHQPILRRKTEGMSIANPGQLGRSRQRAHDDATEAGGFADALGVDVGAGF